MPNVEGWSRLDSTEARMIALPEDEQESVLTPVRSLRRLNTFILALVACGIVLAITFFVHPKALQHKSRHHPHVSFVNYEALPVNISENEEYQLQPLCAPDVVLQTCAILNSEAVTSENHDPHAVDALALSLALSVSVHSVKNIFVQLGMHNTVSCQDLCERVVGSFQPKALAQKSNVGCYVKFGDIEATCDINLSPSVLSNITFSDIGQQFEKPHRHDNSEIGAALDHMVGPTQAQFDLMQDVTFPNVSLHTLKLAIANKFQIFPLQNSAFHKTNNGERRLNASSDVNASREGWENEVMKISVKTQAFISLALDKFNSRKIPDLVELWFGNNLDYPTRHEINRLLNGMRTMLNSVDYVRGAMCQEKWFAYVVSAPHDKDSNGQFIVNLCEAYFQSNEVSQIETLAHEVSHHMLMDTLDSKWKEVQMYGKIPCKVVALACRAGDQEACSCARRNADTIGYFMADAAGAYITPFDMFFFGLSGVKLYFLLMGGGTLLCCFCILCLLTYHFSKKRCSAE